MCIIKIDWTDIKQYEVSDEISLYHEEMVVKKMCFQNGFIGEWLFDRHPEPFN